MSSAQRTTIAGLPYAALPDERNHIAQRSSSSSPKPDAPAEYVEVGFSQWHPFMLTK